MKILIMKLCTPITFTNKKNITGSFKEIENFCKCLKSSGYEYTVLTSSKYLSEFDKAIDIVDYDLKEIDTFDAIFCFNNTLSAYGGKINNNTLSTYFLMNYTSKVKNIPTFYLGADTQIKISSLTDWLNHKNSKLESPILPYEYCSDSKNSSQFLKSLVVDQLDIDGKDLNLLSPVYQTENKLDWSGKENEFKNVYSFPFYITHLFDMNNIDKTILSVTSLDRDILYYGNSRNGKRTKKMVKFYDHNSSLNINFIGKLEGIREKFKNLKDGQFLGPMPMKELYSEIKKSLAHCYISDPQNENRMWTPRLFEAIMNRTVVFIDIDNDPNRSLFPSFFYVSSFQELEQKVNLIKTEQGLREQMLELQYKTILDIFNNSGNLFEKIFSDLK